MAVGLLRGAELCEREVYFIAQLVVRMLTHPVQ